MPGSSYPADFDIDLARAGQILRLATSGIEPSNPRSLIAHLPRLACRLLGGYDDVVEPTHLAWARLYDASRLIDQVQDGHLDDFGEAGPTLNVAVALFFAAAEQIGQLPVSTQARWFTLLRETVTGQFEERVKSRPRLAEALAVAEKKTGAFLGLGCWAGGASALPPSVGSSQMDSLEALLTFGRAYGALLQIHDDLGWLESLPQTAHPGAEPFTNVVLAAAWELEAAERHGALEQSVLDLAQSGSDAGERLRHHLVTLGVRVLCAAQAHRYRRLALAALDTIPVSDPQANAWLRGLVETAASAFRMTRQDGSGAGSSAGHMIDATTSEGP